MHELHIISWNVTRRCNLECGHCYLPAETRKERAPLSPPGELTTKEGVRLIDQLARVNPEGMLILSGGEPLLRGDIFDLAAHASRKGMMVVFGSNGLLIDGDAARMMKRSGVSGISISLDSADPEVHDAIRAREGAWDSAVAALAHCREAGLSLQINTVVSRSNYKQLPELAALALRLGAKVFSPFFLVCTGRGEELTDLSPQQYEQVLASIVELQEQYEDLMIRTRCAPTIRRILHEKNPGSRLLAMGAGRCLAGQSYCRITPEGDVTPCPYLPFTAGSVREREFADIWHQAALFNSLRKPSLQGKCGECSFRILCGGCRARAYAAHRDVLAEDPWCDHIPGGEAVVPEPAFGRSVLPDADRAVKPRWTAEAEERLKKVPSFVRAMVRGAVERYAAEHHCREITPSVMEELKQKAVMGGMHGH